MVSSITQSHLPNTAIKTRYAKWRLYTGCAPNTQRSATHQVTDSGLRNADGSPIGGSGGAAPPPPGGADLASMLQAKANALKTPDLTEITEAQETTIVGAIQNALSSRRQGLCYSVYGQDATGDWDDEDDSWMDF